MSAFPKPALSAIAQQLIAALDEYQAEFDELLSGRHSLESCRQVSQRLDEVVMLKGALPQLSVQMVELLVCHTELMHVLWGAVPRTPDGRRELVDRHREALLAMRRRCQRLFGEGLPH